MVPAFRLIVKRQRHDQLIGVLLEGYRLQLAQGLHGADKFLGSFPSPGVFDARRDANAS